MEMKFITCDLCNRVITEEDYKPSLIRGENIDLCSECVTLLKSRQLVNNSKVMKGTITIVPAEFTGEFAVKVTEEVEPAEVEGVSLEAKPAEVCDGCEEEPEEKTGSEEETDKSWDEIHAETVKSENKKPGRVRAKIPMPEDTCGINDIRLSDLQKIVNLYNHDWAVSKIAHVMGTSEHVIKNRLNRVREALRNSDEN